MTEVVAAVVGASCAALIAYFAFRYRAKIAYELVSITTNVAMIDGRIRSPDEKSSHALSSSRLKIINCGYKSLREVVLHLEYTKEIISTDTKLSTMSERAVEVNTLENSLEIRIIEFPPNEEILISFSSLGWPPMPGRKLRGTGGSYKIVDLKQYELIKRQSSDFGWFFAALIFGYLMGNSFNA